MKRAPLTLIVVGFLTASLQAGEPVVEKQVIQPPPPPELYGVGFYGAIALGANVYQDRGGERSFDNEFGDTFVFDPNNEVGFYGGIKLGYVFGTGVFRPTIEGDFFYNGFEGGFDTTLRIDGEERTRSASAWINTGAFMGNFILRFAFGRFQPYAGAGVGIYYAESSGVDISGPRGDFDTSGGESHTDLAWQVIGGADYYWTPKFSTFIEYHYLNYTSTQIETSQDRDLGQHLVGAGVRFHF
jgi:opacity protein-like surface antigen